MSNVRKDFYKWVISYRYEILKGVYDDISEEVSD